MSENRLGPHGEINRTSDLRRVERSLELPLSTIGRI